MYACWVCMQTEQEGSAHLEYPGDLLSLGSVHVSLGDWPHMEQLAAVDRETDRLVPLDEQTAVVPHRPSEAVNWLLWALWVNIPVSPVFNQQQTWWSIA